MESNDSKGSINEDREQSLEEHNNKKYTRRNIIEREVFLSHLTPKERDDR